MKLDIPKEIASTVAAVSFVVALILGATMTLVDSAPNPTRVNGVKVEKTKITLDPDSTATEPATGTGIAFGASGKKLGVWNATAHRLEIAGKVAIDVNGNGTLTQLTAGTLQNVDYDGTYYYFDPEGSGTATIKIGATAGVGSILADLDASGTFVDVTAILRDVTYDGTTYQFDPGHTGVPRLRMSAAAGVGSVEVDTDGSAHYAELVTTADVGTFDFFGDGTAVDVVTGTPLSVLTVSSSGTGVRQSGLQEDGDGTAERIGMGPFGTLPGGDHVLWIAIPDYDGTIASATGTPTIGIFGGGTCAHCDGIVYFASPHGIEVDNGPIAGYAGIDSRGSNIFTSGGSVLFSNGSASWDADTDGTQDMTLTPTLDRNADGTTGDLALVLDHGALEAKDGPLVLGDPAGPAPTILDALTADTDGDGTVDPVALADGRPIVSATMSAHQGVTLWSDASTGLTTGNLVCATAKRQCHSVDADTVVATVHVLAVSDCATTQTSDFIALCF